MVSDRLSSIIHRLLVFKLSHVFFELFAPVFHQMSELLEMLVDLLHFFLLQRSHLVPIINQRWVEGWELLTGA